MARRHNQTLLASDTIPFISDEDEPSSEYLPPAVLQQPHQSIPFLHIKQKTTFTAAEAPEATAAAAAPTAAVTGFQYQSHVKSKSKTEKNLTSASSQELILSCWQCKETEHLRQQLFDTTVTAQTPLCMYEEMTALKLGHDNEPLLRSTPTLLLQSLSDIVPKDTSRAMHLTSNRRHQHAQQEGQQQEWQQLLQLQMQRQLREQQKQQHPDQHQQQQRSKQQQLPSQPHKQILIRDCRELTSVSPQLQQQQEEQQKQQEQQEPPQQEQVQHAEQEHRQQQVPQPIQQPYVSIATMQQRRRSQQLLETEIQSATMLALLACICCGVILGLLALVITLIAWRYYKRNRITEARRLTNNSIAISLAAFILGIAIVTITIILIFVPLQHWNKITFHVPV